MINLNAGINKTGYGVVATNILMSLDAAQKSPVLWPIGSPEFDSPREADTFKQSIQRQASYNPQSPSLRIWHQFDLAERYSSNQNTALTFFEVDKLSERDVQHINSVDELFVGSTWAKNIVENQCSTKCTVIPLGVDRKIFFPKEPKSKKDETYRFFSTGKIEKRKGYDVLVEAFNKAFGKDDNVQLHIKWYNPFLTTSERSDWANLYEDSKLGNKIYFHHTKTQEDVAKIMQACDCGVYPTRAEGFGLGILEAIACGKPVITTNYSAHVDFCKRAKVNLIDMPHREPALDGKWFHGEAQWARWGNKETQELADLMRVKYEYFDNENPNYQKALDWYNWENCTNHICKSLNIA